MNDIEELQEVIRELHGVESVHLESVPVTEVFQGKTIWDGVVEVFGLRDHPQTSFAFGWSHETDAGPKRSVTVLNIPPVVSPETAVRAAIVQEIRNAQNRS